MQNIHFLIVGLSHDHIYRVIEHYFPSKIFLISNILIKKSTEQLKNDLESKGINIEIIWIEAFKENTLTQIVKEIGTRVKKLRINFKDQVKIYIGFTGGTNLMAIGAGYSAAILNVEAHYILKENNQIIEFNTSEILKLPKNLKN